MLAMSAALRQRNTLPCTIIVLRLDYMYSVLHTMPNRNFIIHGALQLKLSLAPELKFATKSYIDRLIACVTLREWTSICIVDFNLSSTSSVRCLYHRNRTGRGIGGDVKVPIIYSQNDSHIIVAEERGEQRGTEARMRIQMVHQVPKDVA